MCWWWFGSGVLDVAVTAMFDVLASCSHHPCRSSLGNMRRGSPHRETETLP